MAVQFNPSTLKAMYEGTDKKILMGSCPPSGTFAVTLHNVVSCGVIDPSEFNDIEVTLSLVNMNCSSYRWWKGSLGNWRYYLSCSLAARQVNICVKYVSFLEEVFWGRTSESRRYITGLANQLRGVDCGNSAYIAYGDVGWCSIGTAVVLAHSGTVDFTWSA